jgi:hypothetical protein
MRRYMISYDLYRPGNNYSELTAEIKGLAADWQHPLANLWVVETILSAAEIRALLMMHLVTGDKLYVCEAGRDLASVDIAPGAPQTMTIVNANERAPVKLLANVLHEQECQSRTLHQTRLLTAATVGNL